MAELILALDVPTRGEALRLLDQLPRLQWVKIGSILMTAEGPGLVRELVARGLSVFLDLKWHDIPNTVRGAVQAAVGLGVRMVTVHTVGGREMLHAAVAAAGSSIAVVGVTVLPSAPTVSSTDYPDDTDEMILGGREKESAQSVDQAVTNLARSAMAAGLAGVVCSPLEVQRVRTAIGPDGVIVVPGIRRPQDDPGDQVRIAGPREAALAGATHLVVGRPILTAPDPARVLDDFLAEVS